MRSYPCPNCRRPTHFEVRVCPNCRFTLGYHTAADRFLFLADDRTTWRDDGGAAHDVVVCANNNDFAVCNWLVGRNDLVKLCRACRHNKIIPDLAQIGVPERWGKIEAAKRRLFHTLLTMKLPLETPAEVAAGARGPGLAFSFLYDPIGEQTGTVLITTGHEAGLVTLNILEADDVQREKMRLGLGEPYRTLLGHFRHEVGHFYFSRLIENTAEVENFRKVFGDERISYEAALAQHYGLGGAGWSGDYVSAYATMHPWEDFAETFAHLMHIIDALATIDGFGMKLSKWDWHGEQPAVDFDPYRADTASLVGEWRPFAFAENAVNRSMGQPDLYPFTLSPAIVAKLDYINRLLQRAGAGDIAPLDGRHAPPSQQLQSG